MNEHCDDCHMIRMLNLELEGGVLMTKKNWEKAKEQLMRPWPYGHVHLEADGYDITLEMQPVNDMFHKGILVYINGQFKGRWLTQDCEERRRFMPQRERPCMSPKQIARYNKLPKHVQKELKELREQTYTEYSTHWRSWVPLVKHFEANNKEIRLKADV